MTFYVLVAFKVTLKIPQKIIIGILSAKDTNIDILVTLKLAQVFFYNLVFFYISQIFCN